ncbi:MAG: hypothetical protein HY973_03345 [Candidatus Kerfeldbacteria bacterium]|nr:hypothetical protein [Candidatus Kerfeldbacteria bacterium]
MSSENMDNDINSKEPIPVDAEMSSAFKAAADELALERVTPDSEFSMDSDKETLKSTENKETTKDADKKVWKMVGEQFYKTATTVLGVKTITDFAEIVGRAVVQKGSLREKWSKAIEESKGDLGKYFLGKKEVSLDKEKLDDALADLFKSYREVTDKKEDNAKEKFWQTVKELDRLTKEGGAKYLPAEEKKAYREQLAQIIWQYRKKQADLDGERNKKISRAGNLYIQNKVSGFVVARDALNTAFTATGVPVLRTLGYSAMAALERGSKANREFEKSLLKGVKTKESDSKAAFILKDIVVNSTVETVRALRLQGKKGDKQHKVKDFIEAFGSVSRAFGLGTLAVAQINHENVITGIEKAIGQFGKSVEEHGLVSGLGGQMWHNFSSNVDRLLHLYNPNEAWQKMFGDKPVTGGAGLQELSPELMKEGVAIDTLSHKWGLTIPDLSHSSPSQVHDYANYLHQLDKSFTGVDLKGTSAQEFITKHPEMFKSGQTLSVEEFTTRLKQDIKISTVAAGEGIETKGIQQIIDDPRKFGYTGDLNDVKGIKLFSGRLAHQAALNTEFNGKAIAGVTTDGQTYDMRLGAGARGDAIKLVMDANGKAHYEFGSGLKADELYRHMAQPEIMSGKAMDTSQVPWLDKKVIGGTITELILDKTHKGLSVIDFHSHNGQVNGAFFLDSATHEFLPHYVDAALASGHDHYLQLVNESYTALTDKLDKVTAVAGEVGKGWSAGAKLELANFATEHAGGTGAAQTMHDYAFGNLSATKLQAVVEHLGNQTPQYLKDTDFRSFVSEAAVLQKLNPSAANELWQRGLEYKGKGFKSIDYGFLQQAYEQSRDFAITHDGKFLSATHSPLTTSPIEVPITGQSHFDADFYHHYKAVANNIATSEYTVFNKLKSGLGEQGARNLMSMDVNDFTSESVRGHFGKSFLGLFNNHNFLEKWQTDIALHIKNSSGVSVGERLHNYLVDSKGEWGKAPAAVNDIHSDQELLRTDELMKKAGVIDNEIKNDVELQRTKELLDRVKGDKELLRTEELLKRAREK